MNPALLVLALSALIAGPVFAVLPEPGTPGAVADSRYCGEPERDKHGNIKRSQAVLRRFAQTFPCPSTLDPKDVSCPGWSIDHVIPLASGGCDLQHNLQWLPDTIKACAGTQCKDRWERKYHAMPRQAIASEAP